MAGASAGSYQISPRPASLSGSFWKRHKQPDGPIKLPCERAGGQPRLGARALGSRLRKAVSTRLSCTQAASLPVATGRQPEPRPSYGLHSRRPLPAGSFNPELAECHHLADLIPAPGTSSPDCESEAEGPIAPQAGLEVT